MQKDKYALLDTDFISKMHIIQKDAKDYIRSWLDFCAAHKQTTFKIQENSKVLRMCKVPCAQVMREIYEDKLEETRMGYLRYK